MMCCVHNWEQHVLLPFYVCSYVCFSVCSYVCFSVWLFACLYVCLDVSWVVSLCVLSVNFCGLWWPSPTLSPTDPVYIGCI